MSSTRYICLVIGSVVTCGLASCSKDSSPSPAARPTFEPPDIIHQNVRYSLADWQLTKDTGLQLDDAIDLGTVTPAITDVTVTCPDGGTNYRQHTRFNNVSRLSFNQVLPEALLVRDLKRHVTACNFIVQLSADGRNANGWHFEGTPRTDAGELELTRDSGREQGFRRLRARQMTGQVLKTRRDSSTARLLCDHAHFEPVPFRDRLDMGGLLNQGATAANEAARTLDDQMCRVVFLDQRNQRQEMTPLFLMRFAEGALKVSKSDITHIEQGQMTPGREFGLAEYLVENLEDTPRVVRFNKAMFRTRVRLNPKGDIDGVAVIEDDRLPWTAMFSHEQLGMEMVTGGREFVIPPHGAQKFELRYRTAGRLTCDHHRARIKVNDDVYLHEIGNDHNVVGSIRLETPPELTKVAWIPDLTFDESREHPVGGCSF